MRHRRDTVTQPCKCRCQRDFARNRPVKIPDLKDFCLLENELVSGGSWRGKMGAGICLFKRLGNGILCTGTGIHEKKNRKMGMAFQFEQHRLGLWDLSWDLKKKTISWEMGLGPPPPFTTLFLLSPHRKLQIVLFCHSIYGQRALRLGRKSTVGWTRIPDLQYGRKRSG